MESESTWIFKKEFISCYVELSVSPETENYTFHKLKNKWCFYILINNLFKEEKYNKEEKTTTKQSALIMNSEKREYQTLLKTINWYAALSIF